MGIVQYSIGHPCALNLNSGRHVLSTTKTNLLGTLNKPRSCHQFQEKVGE